MSYTTGRILVTDQDEGDNTIVVPFQPNGVRVTIGGRANATENQTLRCSTGAADGTNQWFVAGLANGDHGEVYDGNNRCIQTYMIVSGTVVSGVIGTFVEFVDLGGGSWGVKFNFSEIRTGTTWNIYFEVFG